MNDIINQKIIQCLNTEEQLYFTKNYEEKDFKNLKKMILEQNKELIYYDKIKNMTKEDIFYLYYSNELIKNEKDKINNYGFRSYLFLYMCNNDFEEIYARLNKMCDDLYEKIINGEILYFNIYAIKENEYYMNEYFIDTYNTTPLLLALRHSHFETNVHYIKHLLENKIYFDINYRNAYGNSIFEMIPYLLKKIEESDMVNLKNLMYSKFLSEIYDTFSLKIEEFGKINKDGNTIYMNVLLSKNTNYIVFMILKLISLHEKKGINSTSIEKIFNIYQINNNDETLLNIFSKNINKIEYYGLIPLYYDYVTNYLNNNIFYKMLNILYYRNYTDNQYKNLIDFVRINKNGETPLINLCKYRQIHYLTFFDGCKQLYNCSLKANIDYVDNYNNTALIYGLKRKISKESTRFFELSNNKNHVNNEGETAFYLACKNGNLGFASIIYEKDLTNTDVYPKNQPSALYYFLKKQGEEEYKNYLNKKSNLAYIITNKSDRMKVNELFNYGKNKKLFSKKRKKYDIKEVFDTWNQNIDSYNFIQKKIFILRYKPFLIKNNILTEDLASLIVNYMIK